MKKKIVLWGADEKDNKILVALELMAKENIINIFTFNEALATEEFYNSMMDDWRIGKDVDFPEGHNKIERPLSMTDELLPDSIKVIKTDIISRAKAEWHFVVLSSKLYELYRTELEEFKDRVAKLGDFESGVFEDLKSFWSKVSEQTRERNIFKEHAERLKAQTNELFDKLKELRSKANAELTKLSKEKMKSFNDKLDALNEKVEKGLGLNPIFEELKRIQNDFKKETFTREDGNKLWARLDSAFKYVKEKKYGKREGDQNQGNRLDSRFAGLMSAIGRMQQSIDRDKRDMEFQTKRAGETDGQLEMQIRQAKVLMIQERVNSKQEKLNEMLATKIDLEKKKVKQKARAEKAAEVKAIEKKKDLVKEKIANEISANSEDLKLEADKLEKAASEINTKPKKKSKAKTEEKKEEPKQESLIDALSTMATETLEDVVDTVKAVSEVVGNKMEDSIDEMKEKLHVDEKITNIKATAAEIKSEVLEKIDEAKESLEIEKKIKAVKKVAAEIKEDIQEKVEDIKNDESGLFEKIASAGKTIMNEVEEAATDIKEMAEDAIEGIKENLSKSEEE